MSTRSITNIYEMESLQNEDGNKLVCSFFRHCDGYPSGHGQDLSDWLKSKSLVNGIGGDFVNGRDFNRAGTMAVPLMSHIQELSGCEVVPTGARGQGEDYTYNIKFKNNAFYIECLGYANEEIEVLCSEYDGKYLENLWQKEQPPTT